MELFRMFGEVALKGGEAIVSELKVIDFEAARTARQLREIPNKVETEVDVDTDKAESKIAGLMKRISTMQAGIMAMGPAVVPVLASVVGAAGGLGVAFATAGAGVASFAAIAIPALTKIFDASKEIEKINEKLAKADTAKERAKAMKELEAVYGSLTTKEKEALTALQKFKSFWDGFVQSLQDPVLDVFIKSLNGLQGLLTRLKPMFQSSIQAVSDVFNKFNQALQAPEFQQFFNWLNANAGPSIRTFGDIAINVFRGIIGIFNAFTPLAGDMQNGLLGLSQRFAEWATSLQNSKGFQQFIDYVRANGPILMDILMQVAELVTKVIQSLAPFGPIVLQVVQSILQLVNWLLQLHPAIGTVLVGLIQGIGVLRLAKGSFDTLKGAIDFLKQGFQDFMGIMRSVGPVLLNLAKGGLTAIINGFRGFLQVLNMIRIFLFTNPFGLLLLAITAIVLAAIWLWQNWDQVKAWLINIWNAIKSAALSVWNGIVNFIKSVITGVANFIKSIWNGIKSFASSVWNGIKSIISSVWNGIKSAASSIWNGIKSFLTGLWNGLKNTVSSVWSGIKNTIVNIWNGVMSFLRGINLVQIGKNIIQGLINGVGSMARALWNKVKSIASGIIDSIKSVLGISSPSKVMMQVGEWTGEGLEMGMGKRLPNIVKQTKEIGSAIQDTSLNTLKPPMLAGAGAAGSAGGITINNYFNIPRELLNTRERDNLEWLAQRISVILKRNFDRQRL